MSKAKGYSQQPSGTLTRDDGQVEAVRYYKVDGANFTGWIVRSTSDQYSYSDPIPTKPEAIEVLLSWDRVDASPRTYHSDALGAVTIPED